MPLTEYPSQEGVDQRKEPWDFEKFVRSYNETADRCGGWYYKENQGTADLASFYKTGSFQSIKEYAEMQLEYEQST